jgi:hypothetical protein
VPPANDRLLSETSPLDTIIPKRTFLRQKKRRRQRQPSLPRRNLRQLQVRMSLIIPNRMLLPALFQMSRWNQERKNLLMITVRSKNHIIV